MRTSYISRWAAYVAVAGDPFVISGCSTYPRVYVFGISHGGLPTSPGRYLTLQLAATEAVRSRPVDSETHRVPRTERYIHAHARPISKIQGMPCTYLHAVRIVRGDRHDCIWGKRTLAKSNVDIQWLRGAGRKRQHERMMVVRPTVIS